MKATTKSDKFTIKYIQIPYDNRYFVVYYGRKEIMRLPSCLVTSNNYKMFWGDFGFSESQISKFFERVTKKDAFLDSTND